MPEQGLPGLLYQIEVQKEELDNRASSLLGERRTAFQDLNVRLPRLSPAELAFYQVVTWLYGFYYEAGRVSLRFLIGKFGVYGLASEEDPGNHYQDIRFLRTYLQHNLNLESSTDLKTQRYCEEWFQERCGSAIPGTSDEWNECLFSILRGSINFLSMSIACVRAIERDEAAETVVRQWLVRIRRHHPKHEFENLVAIVIHDLGQDSLDVAKITAQHYEKWSNDLLSRSLDYVFEEEGRKLIEQTILSEGELPLPISGVDLISTFGIPSGPEIGRLLRSARRLYQENPCGKDELLFRLRESETV